MRGFCCCSYYFVFCRHFSVSHAASFPRRSESDKTGSHSLSLIPSLALMQQKCVIAELSPTSFCSHSKLAHLLALPLRLCLLQWPLCKVSLSGFCCLCETESAYFNNKGGVVGPTLLFPWYSVKYQCLLRQALLCREWDNVLFIP